MEYKIADTTATKLKMGLMGFQGSGKTFTATDVAIGLVDLMRQLKMPEGDRPILFIDSERGSRWVLPKVKAAGIDMIIQRTRAFTDLAPHMTWAEANASVLIIDSISAPWVEFCETYAKAKAAQYRLPIYQLQMRDWAFLKAKWRSGFTDHFVNSDLHIIMCGRAGYEFDMVEDEDTKKKQLEKVGIKFRAEGEVGYEPDLLVLMERVMNMATKTDEHVAHVVKDRSTLLDGQIISDPTFTSFLPHIKELHMELGQKAAPSIDTSRTSAAAVPPDAPRDRGSMMRAIVVEELNDLLLRHGAGSTGEASRKLRSELCREYLGSVAKTEIEDLMPLSDLRGGFDALHRKLEGKPSRYSAAPSPPLAAGAGGVAGSAVEIGDRLPDHSAPPAVVAETVTMTAETGTMIDLRDPIPLGEAAAAVVAKAKRTRKAITLAAGDAARSAPEVEAIPPFLRRGNGILSDESWGTD